MLKKRITRTNCTLLLNLTYFVKLRFYSTGQIKQSKAITKVLLYLYRNIEYLVSAFRTASYCTVLIVSVFQNCLPCTNSQLTRLAPRFFNFNKLDNLLRTYFDYNIHKEFSNLYLYQAYINTADYITQHVTISVRI